MKLAYNLAEKARGKTSPNPFVGAVIVKNGKIVGKGYTQSSGNDHAEIRALKDAKEKAKDATMYVTLEPCNHYGKTPPCCDAIIKAGIKEVVIGIKDPNPLTSGGGIQRLKQAGIEVKVGIMKKEIEKQTEIFRKYITKKLPFVCIKTACSLDGKITTKKGIRTQLSGKETQIFVHKTRNQYDAIMVGTNTILIDNPYLTVRKYKGKNPVRIVLDRELKIPMETNVLQQNPKRKKQIPKDESQKTNNKIQVIVATSKKASNKKKLELAKKEHIEVLEIPVNKNGKLDLKKLFSKLAQKEITSILVEGGGTLNGELINQKLVDKMIIIKTPIIIGNHNAPNIVENIKKITLKDIHISKSGQDAIIEGNF